MMKNAAFIMLALVLGAGVVSGCAEKKQAAEKAGEAAVQEQKAVADEPAEVKEAAPAPVAASEEKTGERIMDKAVEVKEEAVAAAEKAVVKVEEKIVASGVAVKEAFDNPAADVKNVEAGAAIFKSKCAPCHGPLGKGTPMAPAFAGNEWIKSAADAEIAGVIKNGRDGAAKRYPKFAIGMPSNKSMADGDISALVSYLRSIN